MLFRFDPFEELDRRTAPAMPALLAMDAVRNDDEIVVYLDAPGVTPDDIDVTAEQGAITIEVNRRWNDSDSKILARERTQGQFRRQLQVSSHIDLDAMQAKYEDGVITLSLPIADRAKARKVQIDAPSSGGEITTG